ncbi:ligand-binding sensor domain-containing diguanylate cyclase [Coralloluteibacterium stylophorae]|uniref:diguanylate cyclase n=1 Tax=Coralloluteibacterium stylophorae TaxID=1776034 RepID=A0A8J7VR20_9GAMM|nr:ligand-binding sensor domain-containing diguanylate cyclase [Coralloluteibacterium stylophorae]MBS7458255.1 diguanylate cyclase [Coralloluteibacterium stylophorae]
MLLAAAFACAQARDAAPEPAVVHSLERFGLDDGLSQLSVTALALDDQGFLWVGTQEGLNRFDGHGFEVYRRDPEDADAGLASSSIEALAFDRRRRLWLGTDESGLEVVDLGSWRRWRLGPGSGLSHARVRHVLLDADDGAWLGTEAGVDRVGPRLDRVRRLGATPPVVGLAPDPAGAGALVLDRDCGLWRASSGTLVPLPVELDLEPAPACVAMAADGGGVWLATRSQGLVRLDAAGAVVARLAPATLREREVPVTALGALRHGGVLVGHADGAVLEVRLRGGAPEVRPLWLDPVPGSAITALHQDAGDLLWIGTYTDGLQRVRPLSGVIRNDRIADAAGWPSRSARAIGEDGGGLLLGTDAGLLRRRAGAADWQPVAAFAGRSVRALLPADAGWWVGTHDGLYRWDPPRAPVRLEGLPDARVEDLLETADGLWIATRGGLALRTPDGAVSRDFGALDGQLLTCLRHDADGTLWIGSNEQGLWRLRPGADPERVAAADGRLPDSVWALHADAGAVWIGSFSEGLVRLDRASGATRRFTERDGLSNNVVYRIVVDGDARLWLSTNAGLTVLNPGSGVIQTLGRRDGLRNHEYNSGSGLRGGDGLLYFGGTEGVDVLDPARLSPRSLPARPAITAVTVHSTRRGGGAPEVRAGGAASVYAAALELGYDDSVLAFALTAIDLAAPAAARLRYRLAPLHQDWVYPQAPRTEFWVSRLQPGDYSLEVQAAGRDGRFGPSRLLALHMPPPPWRHPLAHAAYVLLALVAAAWLAWRVRVAVRRERRRAERLHRLVAERTAQLEEANLALVGSNARLEEANRRDPLTQVSNRRDLHDWLARECDGVQARLDRGDGEARLVFFMIDIDDFKHINDEHGHQAGDQVLVHFAERLRQLCREDDVLARWGGEEFMLASCRLRMDDAAGLAERIRATVAAHPFRLDCGRVLPVTCSVGFAPWPLALAWPRLGDSEQSVDLADRCLYAAKAAGKDTWVGIVAAPGAGRGCLQALLAGAAPDALAPGCVELLHPAQVVPRFLRQPAGTGGGRAG